MSETHEHNTSGGNVSRHDDDQPKRSRPSDYSFQVAISICARLAEGKSLRAICTEAGMPGRATVFRWIACHKEFRDADDPCVFLFSYIRLDERIPADGFRVALEARV